MSRDPLARVSTVATPQTRRIPGRTDQITNNAGGYVFDKDLWNKVEDFLILGTTGGTYYVDEARHTEMNADWLLEAVAKDGVRLVNMIQEIATAMPARALKPRPYLFALAAAHAQGDLATRRAVRSVFSQVVRTTDHLSSFFGYAKALGGKVSPHGHGTAPVGGRLWRSTLESWFTHITPDELAFKACKAMQRKTPQGELFALRDGLRVAHPMRFDCDERRTVFGWIAGNVPDEQAREVLPAVDKFLRAKAVTSEAEAVRVVNELRVPWEFLPDEAQNKPRVWDVLVDTVGMTALIRNLGRVTEMGTLKPMSDATRRVVARLTNAEALKRARIHPMDLYMALRVYASGQSQPNPKARLRTWSPVPAVMDALEEAYEASFGYTEPNGKRLLVAVDCSGSMGWSTVYSGGSPLGRTYDVACAMAVMFARLEPNVHVIEVDASVHASKITRRTNAREIASWRPSGGATDLSLPFTWAQKERMDVDGVVVLTDGETWKGERHASQALESYRKAVNPAARVIVAAMTAAGHSIADPKDPGALNVAGLDGALPKLVDGFLRAR